MSSKVARISVLNGSNFFTGFLQILDYSLSQATGLLDPELVERFRDEIEILPHYLFYRLGIYRDEELPGFGFENCRICSDEETGEPLLKRQKIGYLVLGILVPYLFKKLKRYFGSQVQGVNKKYLILKYIEGVYKFCEAINTIQIIRGALYPNLLHRILEIRYQVIDPKQRRWLEYEFMNRTIVWQEISNFLVFLLPYMNSLPITKMAKKLWLFTTLLGPLSMDLKSDDDKHKMACAHCSANPPVVPKVLECGHVFCSSCFLLCYDEEGSKSTEGVICPICGKVSKTIRDKF